MRKEGRKRLAVMAAAGLLVVGVAGVGAVTTLTTSLGGNQFSASIDSNVDPAGALLVVTGEPIVHEFDITTFNDSVDGAWTIENMGDVGVSYDGVLTAIGDVPASLAAQLRVEYGLVDSQGEVTQWIGAGTLAESRSYNDTVGNSAASLDAAEVQLVPVRITLADPTQLEGADGETLTVHASFDVTYFVTDAS